MVEVFTNSKKQSLRLKWLCIEVARLCCDLSDALPEMICLCFVNAVPKVSIFVRLDTLPGREAEENIIFFVSQRSTTSSARLAG